MNRNRRLARIAALWAVALTFPLSIAAEHDAWRSRVLAEVASREYEFTRQGGPDLEEADGALQAPNRAHDLRTRFTATGILVVPRSPGESNWEWGLSLVGHGRAGATSPARAAVPSAAGNRVDYRRGEITEWYVNDPRGLEQGFRLDAPPEAMADAGEAPMVIELELSGSLSAYPSEDGRSIDFRTAQGAAVLRYAELHVADATGRELPSRMEAFAAADRRGVRLVFEDAGAVYPVTVDPLATSPSWTAEANQAGASFGFSVSTAGDVNGDGFSDAIVGAWTYDNGQTDEGRAFVYLGTPSGLSSTPIWTAEGNQLSGYFGYSVATAGDVNGDGYDDVIVGAESYYNGQSQTDNEGCAFVYHGSATGLTASHVWLAESNQVGANLGAAVASAGDVNGDGYDDVVVGADGATNGQANEGRAFLYLGSVSGLSPTAAWSAESDQAGANFGFSVGTAGDVNGDGRSDVIVGAWTYDNGQTDEGRAFVYLGTPSGLSSTPSWTAEGNQLSGYFGFSVSTAGDVNGDGYADVIVGAESYDNGQAPTDNEGCAFVYHGSATGLTPAHVRLIESDQAGAVLGHSVATAGDVNGDGYADVIVGAPSYDFNSVANRGRVLVYLGSASGLGSGAAWTADGDAAGDLYGTSVATAGDVDGDGYSDLLIGGPAVEGGQTDEGRAYAYLGSAAGLASTAGWTAGSDQASADFGVSVATAGDVNGDGYSDVIVGASGYDHGQAGEGQALVYHGSASGLATTAAWASEGNEIGASFGMLGGDGGGRQR
jgi:hypothetical protein